MTTADTLDAPSSALRIEGELTIYRAEELKSALLAAVERTMALEINLADVTEIDAAGAQLLMLAKKAAEAKNGELRLVAHSPAVVEVFDLLCLAPYFGDSLTTAPDASCSEECSFDSLSAETIQ